MSKTKRRIKAKKRLAANPPPRNKVLDEMYESHIKTHPWCSYGRQPHFVPPSLGDPGFYACEGDKP
jgi:hypothetical protein